MKSTIAGAVSQAYLYVRNKSILEKVRSGIPIYEAAAEEGISTAEASERMDMELLREKKQKDRALKTEIISLFSQNFPAADIAKRLDMALTEVNKIINRHTGKSKDILNKPVHKKEKYAEINPDVNTTLTNAQQKMRNDAVEEAYKNGAAVNDIAGKFFLKPGNVYYILRNRGVEIKKEARSSSQTYYEGPSRPYKYDHSFRERAISLYEELLNVSETALQLNVDKQVIYGILRNNGIPLHKKIREKKDHSGIDGRIKYDADFCKKVVDAFNPDVTAKELSARLNVDVMVIYKILRENNLKPARPVSVTGTGRKSHDLSEGFARIRESYAVRHAYMFELLNEGKTLKEIGEIMNMNPRSVWNLFNSKGLYEKKRTELVKERDEAIFKLYNEGKSIEDLAEQFNIKEAVVRKALNKNGVVLERSIQRILDLFKTGITPQDIAGQLNLTKYYIKNVLRREGLLLVTHHEEREALFRKLYEGGSSVLEIAEKLGIVPAQVFMRLVKLKYMTSQQAYAFKQKTVEELSEQGMSREELAKQFNLRLNHVDFIVKGRRHFHTDRREERKNKMIAEFKNGKPLKQLEKEYKLGHATMLKYFKEEGIRLKIILKKRNTERNEKIAECFNKGMMHEEIAAHLDITETIVRKVLQGKKLFLADRNKKKTQERNDRIAEKFRNGATREQLAGEFSLSLTTLGQILSAAQLNKYDLLAERDKKICSLFLGGTPINELKEKFGMNENNLRGVLYRNNINPKKFFAEQRYKIICKLWQEGKTSSEIAQELNVTEDFVNLTLRKNGVSKRAHKNSQRNEFNEQVRKMYEEGKSREEIHSITGRSIDALKKIFIKLGINERKDNFAKVHHEIVKLYRKHVPVNEIAQRFDYSPKSVGQVLTEMGIIHSKEVKSKENRLRIVTAYRAGKSIEEIADLVSITRSTVMINLRREGIFISEETLQNNKAEALRLAKEGKKLNEISSKLGIHPCTISGYISGHNLNAREIRDNKRYEEIAQAWRSGKTYSEIEKEFNLKNSAVRHALHKSGIFPQQEWLKAKYEKIIALYKEGFTKEEISKQMNTSSGTIGKVLCKNNINVRRDFNEKRRLKIAALYKEGKTMEDIQRETGLKDRGSIETALRKNGISKEKDRLEKTQKRNERIKELFDQGMKPEDISALYHLTVKALNQVLVKQGWDRKALRSVRLKDRNEKVAQLLKEGKSKEEVKQLFGITDRKVREIVSTLHVRPFTIARDRRDSEIIAYYIQPGINPRDVLKKFNIKHSLLYSILNRHKEVQRKVPKNL